VEEKIYKVAVVNARKSLVDWIKNRGGVNVWVNTDPSDIGSGEMFTPALTAEGNLLLQPHSSRELAETVHNIKSFQFIKSMVFLKSIKITMKPGSNGPTLTDASRRRLKKEVKNLNEVADVYFHFEGNNAVIERAIWK